MILLLFIFLLFTLYSLCFFLGWPYCYFFLYSLLFFFFSDGSTAIFFTLDSLLIAFFPWMTHLFFSFYFLFPIFFTCPRLTVSRLMYVCIFAQIGISLPDIFAIKGCSQIRQNLCECLNDRCKKKFFLFLSFFCFTMIISSPISADTPLSSFRGQHKQLLCPCNYFFPDRAI